MNYYEFKIDCSEEQKEIIIAFLSELPFDTFEEIDTGVTAYVSEKLYVESLDEEVKKLSERFEFTFEKNFIPYQNWNEIWESNFQPIQVVDFVGIRADFHAKMTDVEHEIIINPKMAFGTGHHETTYMMMLIMRDLDFTNKTVFDYGCGTGILAVLAVMRGATDVDAVDIELPSYENTLENSKINEVSGIHAFHGILEDVPTRKYDIILANINRNVILPSFSELFERLKMGGNLLISGFILDDEELMKEAAQNQGFVVKRTEKRGNWVCMQLVK